MHSRKTRRTRVPLASRVLRVSWDSRIFRLILIFGVATTSLTTNVRSTMIKHRSLDRKRELSLTHASNCWQIKKNGRNRDNALCVCGLQICAVLKRHYIQNVQHLFCDILKRHTTVSIIQSVFHRIVLRHVETYLWLQGWRSGENTRLPPMRPGFKSRCWHVGWVFCWFSISLAARGFFQGTPVFPSHQKPTFPNSNSTRNQVDEEPLRGCATSKSLFIIHTEKKTVPILKILKQNMIIYNDINNN